MKYLDKIKSNNFLIFIIAFICIQTCLNIYFDTYNSVSYVYIEDLYNEIGFRNIFIDFSPIQLILPYKTDISNISTEIILLFLLSFSLYYLKKGKPTFASCVLLILIINASILIVSNIHRLFSNNIFFWLVIDIISNVLWLLLFYYILKRINKNNKTDSLTKEAKKIHRIINVLIDTLVFTFIGYHITNLGILWSSIIGVIVYIFYYTLLEYKFGFTFGKLITGTRVVQDNGSSLTIRKSFIRSLIRYIPIDLFTYFVSNKGWHDKWVGTKVVKIEKTINKWYYYITVPAFTVILILIIHFASIYIDERIIDNKQDELEKQEINFYLNQITENFNKLDSLHTISVSYKQDIYTEYNKYFRVKQVIGDTLVLKLLYSSDEIPTKYNNDSISQKENKPLLIKLHKSVFDSISKTEKTFSNLLTNKDILKQGFKLSDFCLEFVIFPSIDNFFILNYNEDDIIICNTEFSKHFDKYEIIKIKCRKGNYEYKGNYPIKMVDIKEEELKPLYGDYGFKFIMSKTNNNKELNFDFEITLQDEKGTSVTYIYKRPKIQTKVRDFIFISRDLFERANN
ncbi:MAG: RDD family protein [Marinilabiliaceae bacterium]|nr:RDD family protein [Marinilabiliaceae bacterium]